MTQPAEQARQLPIQLENGADRTTRQTDSVEEIGIAEKSITAVTIFLTRFCAELARIR